METVSSNGASALTPPDQTAAGKVRSRTRAARCARRGQAFVEARSARHSCSKSDDGRLPELVPIRYGRMLQSPFAFFRERRRSWRPTSRTRRRAVSVVQACGDCHLKNFGGFATPGTQHHLRHQRFRRDAPRRRGSGTSNASPPPSSLRRARTGSPTASPATIAVACVRAYRKAIREFSQLDPLTVWYAKYTVEDFLKPLSVNRTQPRSPNAWQRPARRADSDIDYPKLT